MSFSGLVDDIVLHRRADTMVTLWAHDILRIFALLLLFEAVEVILPPQR